LTSTIPAPKAYAAIGVGCSALTHLGVIIVASLLRWLLHRDLGSGLAPSRESTSIGSIWGSTLKNFAHVTLGHQDLLALAGCLSILPPQHDKFGFQLNVLGNLPTLSEPGAESSEQKVSVAVKTFAKST
jgi:hypothetical protein